MPNAIVPITRCTVVVTAIWFSAALPAEEIPPKPVDGKIKWVYSYDEGKKLARESGRPMFVVFRCER